MSDGREVIYIKSYDVLCLLFFIICGDTIDKTISIMMKVIIIIIIASSSNSTRNIITIIINITNIPSPS